MPPLCEKRWFLIPHPLVLVRPSRRSLASSALQQVPCGQQRGQADDNPTAQISPRGAGGALARALPGAEVGPAGQALLPESDVLRPAGVDALAAGDVKILEVVGHVEEHVLVGGDVLEARGVVGELERVVGGGGVAEEDALYLVRVLGVHGGVVLHDVAVAGVGHEDELALREGHEDALEQELADGQGGADVGEVERARVEGAERVGAVDVRLVLPGHLLRQRGQVVEVRGLVAELEVRGPVGVDLGHVHPGDVGLGEGVEDDLRRLPDLGDAEDVVDVGEDGQAGGRHQVGGRVADVRALRVHVEDLDRVGLVARVETIALDRHELVKVSFDRDVEAVVDGLGAASDRGDRREREDGRRGVGVLNDEDLGGDIAGLGGLIGREVLDRGADKEVVGEVVELRLRYVCCLKDPCQLRRCG